MSKIQAQDLSELNLSNHLVFTRLVITNHFNRARMLHGIAQLSFNTRSAHCYAYWQLWAQTIRFCISETIDSVLCNHTANQLITYLTIIASEKNDQLLIDYLLWFVCEFLDLNHQSFKQKNQWIPKNILLMHLSSKMYISKFINQQHSI